MKNAFTLTPFGQKPADSFALTSGRSFAVQMLKSFRNKVLYDLLLFQFVGSH